MSRIRVVLLTAVLFVIALALWIRHKDSAPPLVAFVHVERQTLVSTLSTNGKVEPSDLVAVRAERPGIIDRVDVQKGQQVPKGAPLVELDSRDARAAVSAAEAAVQRAGAQLHTISKGGTAAAQVEIANEIERNRMDLKTAQRDYESLRRLLDKQAATKQDVAEASQRVQALQIAIEALERKRAALVGPADRTVAGAQLREAEAALEQARVSLERSHIHSPIAGIVYQLPVRDGAYVNIGDLVAGVGNLQTLRVRIYVDEPELGRVAVGMPVSVTWDALPGRVWQGTVEKLPTEIVALGTRQVGEVLSTIANDDLKLLPGTNVNVEITSQVVENGLTIAKEAIRTENGRTGVYVLRDDHVEWRPVRLGASSITRAVVNSGLTRDDMIALPTSQPLRNGQAVRVDGQ